MNRVNKEQVITLLKVSALVFLYAALFAGKYSFDRFFEETSRSVLLELRVWFAVAVVVAGISLAWNRAFKPRTITKSIRWLLALHALFAAYLVVNALILGDGRDLSKFLLDISIVLIGFMLIAVFFRGEHELLVFLFIAELTGAGLFLLAAAGVGNPELNGPGWAPFGGPITFYRIEFLAFGAALYLSERSSSLAGKVLHLVVAGACFFSTLASLSKAAFASAVVSVLFMCLWLAVQKQYRTMFSVVGVVAVVIALFYGVDFGQTLAARFAESKIEVFSKDRQVDSSAVLLDVYAPDLRFETLSPDKQRKLEEIWPVYSGLGAPHYQKDPSAFLRFLSRVVIIGDTSSRIQMLMLVLKDARSSFWFGRGMGSFRFAGVNTATKEIEIYRYPHNILLELLFCTGIIGLALFGIVVFTTAVLVGQTALSRPGVIFLAGYLLFIFLTATLAGDYYDFRTFWFVSLACLFSLTSLAAPGRTP